MLQNESAATVAGTDSGAERVGTRLPQKGVGQAPSETDYGSEFSVEAGIKDVLASGKPETESNYELKELKSKVQAWIGKVLPSSESDPGREVGNPAKRAADSLSGDEQSGIKRPRATSECDASINSDDGHSQTSNKERKEVRKKIENRSRGRAWSI